MEQVLCSILFLIIGDVGRGVATLAVMSMGIGAMMGKVSWGQALTVAVGIGIMFGAPVILPLLMFSPTGLIGDLAAGHAPDFYFPCIYSVTIPIP
jgi:type IV secretory pathway VirB2 component (pilin)